MRIAERPALLVAGLALLAACSLDAPYLRVRVEMPSAPSVKTEDYKEIVVADLFLPEPASDVDLNAEMTAYFQAELGLRFKGAVSRRSLSVDNEARLREEAFWKQAAGGSPRLLFLTGKVKLDQELRKALLEKDRGRKEDPFAESKTWDERKTFTLQATLLLIDGSTGRPVFDKEYKEVATYANIRQPAGFALFDIMQRLKAKFFRSVFGTDRIQERYLLYK